MSSKRETAAIAGVGVVACAACCAGPIMGVLAAIGIGTAAGVALFGVVAVVVGVAAAVFVVVRRRRRQAAGCSVPVGLSVPVAFGETRGRL